MPLALIRRLVKGSPLTATEHDTNLNVLEAGIAASLQPGQAIPSDVECRNNSGVGLTAGAPVFITSSSGTKPTVALADASSESTAARSLGLVVATVSNNADCVVRTHGILTGVNTAALTEGLAVWLSETTGQLTTTRPTQPAHGVFFGFCVKQAAGTAGILYINVINGLELAELHDVLLTGAATDDVLALASDGLWKKRTLGSAAAAAITDFAPAAQGVSNGNSHNHDGGDGAQIAYGSLSGLPGNFTDSAAGLVPASGGGTSNFLRADGTFAAPPTGGTPGGTSGQLQYNNAGAFAGVPNTSVDPATGNTTFSARWIQLTNSAASAPATALTGTWFTGGTSTTTKPHFLIEPAGATSASWSTAGTGFGVNAPSGFAGDLAWFGVNGNHAFRLTPGSEIIGQNGLCKLGLTSGIGAYLSVVGSYQLSVDNAGIGLRLGAGSPSIYLVPEASNVFAQRNSTAAQAFRIYNTFTADANFERLSFRWTSNEAIIDTEAGGSGGTLRGLKIGSASTSLLGFYGATPAARGAAVADATDAATAITQLNALLARIRTLGLIAT